MKRFLFKASSFMVALVLVFLLAAIPQAQATTSTIKFGYNLYTPIPPYNTNGVVFVDRNFFLGLPITSPIGLSKVSVKVENVKTDMAWSQYGGCKYCEGYVANVKLGANSPNGIKNLVVTATDTKGHSESHTYPVVLGDPNHIILGDLNFNGILDIDDVKILITNYGKTNQSNDWFTPMVQNSNLNNDRIIDAKDLLIIVQGMASQQPY